MIKAACQKNFGALLHIWCELVPNLAVPFEGKVARECAPKGCKMENGAPKETSARHLYFCNRHKKLYMD